MNPDEARIRIKKDDNWERKLGMTERAAKWLRWVVVTTALAVAAWGTLGARVSALEKDLVTLSLTAKTKDSATADRELILTKLDEAIGKQMTIRFDAIDKRLDQIERRIDKLDDSRRRDRDASRR